MGRMEQVTKLIQAHDYRLYCSRDKDGKLCIFRKSEKVEWFDIDGVSIGFVRPTPNFIMALTHNWQQSGYPVEWGLIPILNRLQAMDLWNRDLAGDLTKDYEERERKVKRDASNKTEDFLKEWRKPFAKEFEHVNTTNLEKTDRRKLEEKKWLS